MDKFKRFYSDMEYTINCYRFFLAALRNEECRKLVTTHRFDNEKQVSNYEIDLSWAYFSRLEGVLEAFLIKFQSENKKKLVKRNLVKKNKNKNDNNEFGKLEKIIGQERINKFFDDHEKEGLKLYWEIRNTLNHGDGIPIGNKEIKINDGEEIHLTPHNIKNFYDLFVKAVKVIEEKDN